MMKDEKVLYVVKIGYQKIGPFSNGTTALTFAQTAQYHCDETVEIELQKQSEKETLGSWEYTDEGIICSECHGVFYYDENLKEGEEPFRFCPDCGTPMDLSNRG